MFQSERNYDHHQFGASVRSHDDGYEHDHYQQR
jgi:hypothetical protein